MDETTTTRAPSPLLGAEWSDPIEDGVRGRVRAFIEAILEEELEAALGRGRYVRGEDGARGWRHGHRDRQVIGTFGPQTVSVPRARLAREDGGTAEWRPKGLRRYRRLTERGLGADRRRVSGRDQHAPGAPGPGSPVRRCGGQGCGQPRVAQEPALGLDPRVKTDWEAWNARELGDEDIVRFAPPLGSVAGQASLLDGTVVRARIDRKATAISLLVVIGVRQDGQKILLALRSMGGESTAAWTVLLEDMTRRGLKAPERVIVDGAPGLEAALAALWPEAPLQRCTVHKHRNPGSRPGQALHPPAAWAVEVRQDHG